MSEPRVLAMPGQDAPAGRLAEALGVGCAAIAVRRFPDGESLVRVPPRLGTCLVYCSLDDPDGKLVALMLAASAARDQGARRLVLVAPYLCYMRQDRAFHAGEAVSQRAVGQFLAGLFDRVVTVDPHLHRTHDLGAVIPGIETEALSAAAPLAGLIAETCGGPAPLLVGPDAESRPWVAQVAAPLGADVLVGEKDRAGDRAVSITLPGAEAAKGRPVVLVDDVVSSGATLAACARVLAAAGAARIEAVTTHCLCSPEDLAAMNEAGIARLRSSDSVAHPTNAVALAPLLAEALEREVAT